MEQRNKIPQNVLYTIFGFALLSFLIHLYTNIFAGYEIFRDELYYIACSKRLDTGYVDQPPFSIFMLYLIRMVLGDSVFAIRLIPAVVSGIVVFITGKITCRLGGNIFAAVTAAIAITFAPIFIAMNSIYSMNTFDYLFWILAAYVIILIYQEEKKIHWYMLGIIAGLGLLNKIGFLWFGAGLFTGLLITKPKTFLKKEIYIAGLIALIIFSPYIIWNFTHDFAHLEFISNATKYKYTGVSRFDLAAGQLLLLNPLTFPLWLAGLLYLVLNKEGAKLRILAIIYIVSFLILFIFGNSKPEYLGPAYAPLFAAGGVIIEKFFSRRYINKIGYVVPALILLSGIMLIPLVLPILPVDTFIRYNTALGIEKTNSESKELNELPQFYADMHGWENMAKTVSDAYMELSHEEKSKAVILAQNYGEAGAMEYFGKKYPLPQVISYHNNYWYWINEVKNDFNLLIIIGGDIDDHLKGCESVEQVAEIKNRYAMPYENRPVFLCRKLKINFQDVWNEEKHFI